MSLTTLKQEACYTLSFQKKYTFFLAVSYKTNLNNFFLYILKLKEKKKLYLIAPQKP